MADEPVQLDNDRCLKTAEAEDGQDISAGVLACYHLSYTQDRVTGECRCDVCNTLLIDCIGRVLE